jgi:hypothetical protein
MLLLMMTTTRGAPSSTANDVGATSDVNACTGSWWGWREHASRDDACKCLSLSVSCVFGVC